GYCDVQSRSPGIQDRISSHLEPVKLAQGKSRGQRSVRELAAVPMQRDGRSWVRRVIWVNVETNSEHVGYIGFLHPRVETVTGKIRGGSVAGLQEEKSPTALRCLRAARARAE